MGKEESSELRSLPLPPMIHLFPGLVPPPSFPRWVGSDSDNDDKSEASCSSGVRSRISSASQPSDLLRRRKPSPFRSTPADTRGALRTCFQQWRRFVREHMRRSGLVYLADTHLKKRGIQRWSGFLHWEKYTRSRMQRLNRWKAAHACDHWKAWTVRRRRLRELHNSGGNSFAALATKTRILARWRAQTVKSRQTRAVILEQRGRISQRTLRHVWNALKVHHFWCQQDQRILGQALARLHRYRDEHIELETIAAKLHTRLMKSVVHKLLIHWRMYAYNAVRQRRIVHRVRFELVRSRVFALWRQVFLTRRRTARLYRSALQRKVRTHFSAWCQVVWAMKMAQRVNFNRSLITRRIFFESWVHEAARLTTGRLATNRVLTLRLGRAVAKLKWWVHRCKNISSRIKRLRQKWDKNKLQRCWADGWLQFHMLAKSKKLMNDQATQFFLRRIVERWRQICVIQRARRCGQSRADYLFRAGRCRRCLDKWKTFASRRHAHTHLLSVAERHLSSRMLRVGVLDWREHVHRNSQNAKRTLLVRHVVRHHLKMQCFGRWRNWCCRRLDRNRLCDRYQISISYRTSQWNPVQRMWCRWKLFVMMSKRETSSIHYFQHSLRRKIFSRWRSYSRTASVVRNLRGRREEALLLHVMNHWKYRAICWRTRNAQVVLAIKTSCRSICRRIFSHWARRCTVYLPRVRLLGLQVQCQRQSRLLLRWFNVWRAMFHVKHAITVSSKRRHTRVLRQILASWREYAAQRARLHRKQAYFRSVFGSYPHTSFVARTWQRWRHFVRQRNAIKALCIRRQRNTVRQCWEAWWLFHWCCYLLHAWRDLISADNINTLSWRARQFRKMRRRRRKSNIWSKWTQFVEKRRRFAAHCAIVRRQASLELQDALGKRNISCQCYMKHWFERWRTSENLLSVRCRSRFRSRLLRRILQGWWRHTIHFRQEQVLSAAKEIIGGLSYYEPPIQASIVHQPCPKRSVDRAQAKQNAKLCDRKQGRVRESRRMIDPCLKATYSSSSWRQGQLRSVDRTAALTPVCAKTVKHQHVAKRQQFAVESVRDATTQAGDGFQVQSKPLATSQGKKYSASHDHQQLNVHSIPHGETTAQIHEKSLESSESKPVVSHGVHQVENPSRTWSITHDRPKSHESLAVENELPLFDSELNVNDGNHRPGAVVSAEPTRDVTTAVAQVEHLDVHDDFPTLLRHWSPDLQLATDPMTPARSPFDSLEHLANVNVYDTTTSSIADKMTETQHGSEVTSHFSKITSVSNNDDTPPTTNKLEVRHAMKSRPPLSTSSTLPKALRTKATPDSTVKETDLSEILGLPASDPADITSVIRRKQSAVFDAAEVMDEILSFYASALERSNISGIRGSRPSATLRCMCFEMLRDLQLFQNDFYIAEFEQKFRASLAALEDECSASLMPAEAAHQELVCLLRQFLEDVISAHPAYLQYLDNRRSHGCSDELASTSNGSLPSTLHWLVTVRLHHFVAARQCNRRPNVRDKFWVRGSVPCGMQRALPKFIPILKRYMGVLGQFFTRKAAQSKAKRSGDPWDYRMSKTTFLSLLKEVHAFPQLFHRRELEVAFQMSSISSSNGDSVNFPEFVEVLVRCSSALQWGSVDDSETETDTAGSGSVAIVKFLMLVFAMEGKGSVLHKRSEDLNVVLEFLKLQQQRNRSSKLSRFRRVLDHHNAEQRQEQKKKEHAESPVFRILAQHGAQKALMSPARTLDDLTRSWDSSYRPNPSMLKERESRTPGVPSLPQDIDFQGLEHGQPDRSRFQPYYRFGGDFSGDLSFHAIDESPSLLHQMSLGGEDTRQVSSATSNYQSRTEYSSLEPHHSQVSGNYHTQTVHTWAGHSRAGTAENDRYSPATFGETNANGGGSRGSTDATMPRSAPTPLCEEGDQNHTPACARPALDADTITQQIPSIIAEDTYSNTAASSQRRAERPDNIASLSAFAIDREPMGKDEFLEEIMSSIGDVELLLQNTSRRPDRRPPRERT